MLTGVVGIVFFVFFVFLLYGNGEAVRLRCDSQGYQSGTNINIYCNTSDAPTSNVSWSLVSNTGETTDLGWCFASDSCRSLQSGIRLYRSSITNNYINISPVKQEMAGTVICTETHEGRIHTDNCTLRVVSVYTSSCEQYGYEFTENSSAEVSCYVSDSRRAITWTLTPPSGPSKFLGTCLALNSCNQSPEFPYIQVFRTYSTISYVRFSGLKRETAGSLACSDGIETFQCSMDVRVSAKVGDCNLNTDRSRWRVVGSCNITKAFSALGKFGYRISQTWKTAWFQSISYDLHGGNRLPFTLNRYTNSSDNREYYRGKGMYSWPLPTQDGSYYYTFDVYPGGTSRLSDDVIIIENPTAPTHNCTDLNYLPESGRVPCVCSTSSLGSPAGRLIWFSGDTVLAAGQYGVTSLQFPSGVTDDGCDVMQMTCQLDWILKQNVSFPVMCKAREIIDTDEQNSPDTSSTERVWAITVTAVLAVVVVVVVVLVIVLLMRRHCLSPHQQPQPQPPQPQDPSHTYDALNMGHVTGREGETGPSNAISPAGRDTIYQNADV